ncbi:MAG: molybdopterin molybdotransferase MoeA [Pseudomonadota bacterium]
MISVDEAIATIADDIAALTKETVRIEDGLGRTLAEATRARLTHPPARMSAMDGYAVALTAPLTADTSLEVRGEAPAGAPFEGSVGNGAVRVFTGSVIPDGANHVVIQEDTDRQGDTITLTAEQPEPKNIRQMGTDFIAGGELLPSGRVLGAIDVSLLAAAGISEIAVIRRPKIALFANGNELVAPSETPTPGQVVNSITRGLKPLLESWGASVTDLGVAGDSEDAVRLMFDGAADVDLIVPIGGASVGDYDVVKRLGREIFDLRFEKVAVKPGKPVWFGRGQGRSILGLPGNPSSAFACSYLFVRLAINAFLGRPERQLALETARLTAPVGPNGNRETFMRAVVRHDESGQLCVQAEARQDTALLSPFAASNALLRRKAGAEPSDIGAMVQVLRLSG